MASKLDIERAFEAMPLGYRTVLVLHDIVRISTRRHQWAARDRIGHVQESALPSERFCHAISTSSSRP